VPTKGLDRPTVQLLFITLRIQKKCLRRRNSLSLAAMIDTLWCCRYYHRLNWDSFNFLVFPMQRALFNLQHGVLYNIHLYIGQYSIAYLCTLGLRPMLICFIAFVEQYIMWDWTFEHPLLADCQSRRIDNIWHIPDSLTVCGHQVLFVASCLWLSMSSICHPVRYIHWWSQPFLTSDKFRIVSNFLSMKMYQLLNVNSIPIFNSQYTNSTII